MNFHNGFPGGSSGFDPGYGSNHPYNGSFGGGGGGGGGRSRGGRRGVFQIPTRRPPSPDCLTHDLQMIEDGEARDTTVVAVGRGTTGDLPRRAPKRA